MDHSRLHVPTAVLTVLVTASLLNLGQFAGVNLDMSDWYDAVRVKDGHDLRALSEEHFGSTKERFLLATRLRDLAPGAVLVTPPRVGFREELLVGVGGMSAVERVATERVVDAPTAAALDAAAVATGEDEQVGPYAIVVDPTAPADRLVAVPGPERFYVVDVAIADELGIGL